MSHETLHNAIRTRIEDNLKAYPLAFDNVDVEEMNHTGLWIRAKIIQGETVQASLGASKRFRTVGVVMFQIFTPLRQGDREALKIADKIVALFRSITVDEVTYKTPSVKNVGRDGKWHQINASCPFYYDVTD